MSDLMNNESGCIKTISGVIIDYNNLKPEAIYSGDIATGLSNECRFGGQLRKFYSVGEHSMLVAYLAELDGAIEIIPACLMHDSTEGLGLRDLPKPIKELVGDEYKRLERNLTEVVFERYGIPIGHLLRVKQYDKAALVIEDAWLRSEDEVKAQEAKEFMYKFYFEYLGIKTTNPKPHHVQKLFLKKLDEHGVYPVNKKCNVWHIQNGESEHIAAPYSYTSDEVIEWYRKEFDVEWHESDIITLCTEADLNFYIRDIDGDFEWEGGKLHAKEYIAQYITEGFPDLMCSTAY